MPDLELDIGARLCASLDRWSDRMDREEGRHQRMAQAVRQVPLTANLVQLSSGAGTLDQPQNLGAPSGWYWDVKRLTLSGFTAGTAVIYMNGVGGEPVAPFAQAGTFTFGKGQLLMHPTDRLVVSATGITGTVQLNGAADAIEAWYLPYYLS